MSNTESGDILANPFGSVMYLMAKPIGAACNLRCEYCYYLEKGEGIGRQQMSDQTLEEFIRQYIECSTTEEVVFTWHGGEALMRPIEFYRKAVGLQQRYARGHRIVNCLQTNGTLLTETWCRFLRNEGWLVGISIDGPEEFHDEYRRTATGGPSFQTVMRSIRMLQRYGVEWNALAVVNDYNVEYPEEFYDFFKQIGCKYLQFTPIVERRRTDGHLSSVVDNGELTPHSVTPKQWGEFLCRVFDRWVRSDVGKIFVQIFDSTLARWVGVQPGVCTMSDVCGHAGIVDFNGDVYSCDHFVFPQYKLGNIHSDTIINMMSSQRQRAFGQNKRGSLPDQCLKCRWTMICNGECPKNRFAVTADGQPGLNYLCSGYRRYFEHVAPYMDFMAAELKAQRAPANVMSLFK
ncbi:MAG: anaerobic sulfatase-maturation protein [Bacteroides sp.]|nr:anaerobic sulfatase-maturation protein [Bacteroides sp.]MCM1413204.1 anaerobic sulfatase-maturation protein [Bacteroides sp.]MCM1472054.1 anaerobic sulfatase-maturation protein [Bacteroides sp.]